MQALDQALEEVKSLHLKVVGQPAPDLEPRSYAPFPPNVDPIQCALSDVRALKELWERSNVAPRTAWMPPADVHATDAELVVHVEIPGISREDVKVLLVGGECVVRGERKPPAHAGKMRPLALERPWGAFERRFLLPAGSRADEMRARISLGLLELRIPLERLDDEREQKIEVD